MTGKQKHSLTILGHRGARGHAPENTLQALDAGIRLGAQWLEIDVQLHPEGALLLLHDLTLDRTTTGRGSLAGTPLAIVRELDAGNGQQIPTLQEALECVDKRAGINIELKHGRNLARSVVSALQPYLAAGWPLERLLVSSFHLPELMELKNLAPELPVAPLIYGVPWDWATCVERLDAAALSVSQEFLEPRLIADVHEQGRLVFVYTVNDQEQMKSLRKLGVDGVFTDYPERAAELG